MKKNMYKLETISKMNGKFFIEEEIWYSITDLLFIVCDFIVINVSKS